jgi:hypothetical protein
VPQGWTRSESADGIDYTPDGGVHLLRFGVDPGSTGSARSHLMDLERTASTRPDYVRVALLPDVYQGQQGALWEFTCTDDQGVPQHAIDQAFVAPDGTAYVIAMSSPEDDWPTTRRQFSTVLAGFTLP